MTDVLNNVATLWPRYPTTTATNTSSGAGAIF